MDVRLIPYKIKNRLNKLDSSDFDNLQCHQIVEAYNKAQLEWVRRQLHGGNAYREGSESSITRVDDLQILLNPIPVNINGSNRDYYFISHELPEDYLRYSKVRVIASKQNCKNQPLKSWLREEANSDDLLKDKNSRPDFAWRETFHTFGSNKIKVYTNGDFVVSKIELTYYRNPREIRLAGCDYLGETSSNVDPELKDDIVELIIDEAAAILAFDIENFNQGQRNTQQAERNN